MPLRVDASYPGVTDSRVIEGVNIALKRGQDFNPDRVHISDYPLYHNQAYPDGGVQTMQFFNVAGQEGTGQFVTNMPQANILPINHVFVLRGVAVVPYFHQALAGGANAPGAPSVAAGTPTPFTNLAEYNRILSTGSLQVKVGDRVVVHGPDLRRFPPGRGLSGFGAYSTVTAGEEGGAAVYQPGIPDRSAVFMLNNPYIIFPNRTLAAQIQWLAAIDPPGDGAFALGVELHGSMVRLPS